MHGVELMCRSPKLILLFLVLTYYSRCLLLVKLESGIWFWVILHSPFSCWFWSSNPTISGMFGRLESNNNSHQLIQSSLICHPSTPASIITHQSPITITSRTTLTTVQPSRSLCTCAPQVLAPVFHTVYWYSVCRILDVIRTRCGGWSIMIHDSWCGDDSFPPGLPCPRIHFHDDNTKVCVATRQPSDSSEASSATSSWTRSRIFHLSYWGKGPELSPLANVRAQSLVPWNVCPTQPKLVTPILKDIRWDSAHVSNTWDLRMHVMSDDWCDRCECVLCKNALYPMTCGYLISFEYTSTSSIISILTSHDSRPDDDSRQDSGADHL